jgi:hypothetical protein
MWQESEHKGEVDNEKEKDKKKNETVVFLTTATKGKKLRQTSARRKTKDKNH